MLSDSSAPCRHRLVEEHSRGRVATPGRLRGRAASPWASVAATASSRRKAPISAAIARASSNARLDGDGRQKEKLEPLLA